MRTTEGHAYDHLEAATWVSVPHGLSHPDDRNAYGPACRGFGAHGVGAVPERPYDLFGRRASRCLGADPQPRLSYAHGTAGQHFASGRAPDHGHAWGGDAGRSGAPPAA